MTVPALAFRDAGKRYVKYEDRPMLVTAGLNLARRTRREAMWAVRHVNLSVEPGQCYGIIGRNGAGKSTMLRLLAGTTAPTEGTVSIRGRVAPLVAVGVGFHPELTGRENIYVNGSILGLTRHQVHRKMESIVEFADIGDFLDTPVKFYSSGMFVRLGFAVAVEAEPDVLLVDEVLSVGDVEFQSRSYDRMMQIKNSGTTVVVVSHNLTAIRMMCDRTAVIEAGSVQFEGSTPEAVSLLYDMLAEHYDPERRIGTQTLPRQEGVVEIKSVVLTDATGEARSDFKAGDELRLRIEALAMQDVVSPAFNLLVLNDAGVLVYKEPNPANNLGIFPAGSTIACSVRCRAELVSGGYTAHCMVLDRPRVHWYDRAEPIPFTVKGRPEVSGKADLRARFELNVGR